MTSFRFMHPWLLLLLIPAIIVIIVQWRRRPPAVTVSNVEHFSGKKGSASPRKGWRNIGLLLEAIGLVLLIIAVARPQSGREVILDVSNGIDITLCLDISGSMEFIDPGSSQSMDMIVDKINSGVLKTRIEIAKKELARFIDKRPSDRIGIIVFAGQPYQLCPLTVDKELLNARIKEVNTNMLRQYSSSTGIAAPLTSAIQRLKKSPATRRVIILFTDGAHNQAQELTPVQAAEIAKQFNIIIHTVGIGSSSAVRVTNDIFNRRRLQQTTAQFDEELMKKLAADTGGQYFHVEDKESFSEVMDSIDKLEKVEINKPRYMNYKDLFPWFLYSGIFLTGFAFLLSKTLWLRIP